MRSVFFDANVIIDWLNADSAQNELCTQCVETVKTLYDKPFISPTSIAIIFYIIGKKYKDKTFVKNTLFEVFSHFRISIENQGVVNRAFESKFTDLEDGIQYFSALQSDADTIITFNIHDFIEPKIPILHPMEFLQLHDFDLYTECR